MNIKKTLTKALFRFLAEGGTVAEVAEESGVSASCLSRFLNEERDLYLSSADKLAAFFELEIS